MSTKTSTRTQVKKAPVQAKPVTRTIGTISLKASKVIFDDSTYTGKYVVRLSDSQVQKLADFEKLTFTTEHFSNQSWSTNDFGNQLKINSDMPLIRNSTYDFELKVYTWTMAGKSGVAYKVTNAEQVENAPELATPMKNLGICLI